MACNLGVDARRECGTVRIVGADDDTGVHRGFAVQLDVIPAIVRHDDSVLLGRKCQHQLVRFTLIVATSVSRRDYVMSKDAQSLHNLDFDVLVGIQTRHGSGLVRLVLLA